MNRDPPENQASTRSPPGHCHGTRRRALLVAPALCFGASRQAIARPSDPALRWARAAEAMKAMALSWGDQPYGAVLVKDGRIIGYGPSRVVQKGDPEAHAEREAIEHARSERGALALQGSVLYSTSRPCPRCEAAAARAGVARMVVGPRADDAGQPNEPPP